MFGPYDGSERVYSQGIPEKEGYADAEIHYPASASGLLPIVACCYGFGGSKQTFAAEWTRFLTSWGFVVILFDPFFEIGGIGGGPGKSARRARLPRRRALTRAMQARRTVSLHRHFVHSPSTRR